MKGRPTHINELNALLNAYGEAVIAKLLGVTPRGMANWTSETNPKETREDTKRKISELFQKHQSGEDLRTRQNEGLKDELIASYKDTIESQKDRIVNLLSQINSLKEELREVALANQAIGLTSQHLLSELVSQQRKQDLKKVSFEISKANLLNYESAKQRGNLIDEGK
jgi:hypothetical protein